MGCGRRLRSAMRRVQPRRHGRCDTLFDLLAPLNFSPVVPILFSSWPRPRVSLIAFGCTFAPTSAGVHLKRTCNCRLIRFGQAIDRDAARFPSRGRMRRGGAAPCAKLAIPCYAQNLPCWSGGNSLLRRCSSAAKPWNTWIFGPTQSHKIAKFPVSREFRLFSREVREPVLSRARSGRSAHCRVKGAAVEQQVLPDDKPRRGGAEECAGITKLFRVAHPAGRVR